MSVKHPKRKINTRPELHERIERPALARVDVDNMLAGLRVDPRTLERIRRAAVRRTGGRAADLKTPGGPGAQKRHEQRSQEDLYFFHERPLMVVNDPIADMVETSAIVGASAVTPDEIAFLTSLGLVERQNPDKRKRRSELRAQIRELEVELEDAPGLMVTPPGYTGRVYDSDGSKISSKTSVGNADTREVRDFRQECAIIRAYNERKLRWERIKPKMRKLAVPGYVAPEHALDYLISIRTK